MTAPYPTGEGLAPVLLERLGQDHVRIGGVIREMAELLDQVDADPDWQRLAELIEFLEYYADRVHHPLEDRLFDYLINKGLTPTERRLVFSNLGQHQEIQTLTEILGEQIDYGKNSRPVDLDDIQELANRYFSLQRRHMSFEETQLFPLLEAAFDNKDWNALMGILEQSPAAAID